MMATTTSTSIKVKPDERWWPFTAPLRVNSGQDGCMNSSASIMLLPVALKKCASECTCALLIAQPVPARDNRARAEQNRSKPMTRNGWTVLFGAAFVAVAETTLGQRPASWRVYKLIDGLPESACSSVSISPQGKVLGKHLNLSSASELGGYTVRIVPTPEGAGRIYASPGGQLWTVAPTGLQEMKEGSWVS